MESTLTSSITRCRTHIDVNTTSGCSHFIARGRALVTFICNPATHVARNNLESVGCKPSSGELGNEETHTRSVVACHSRICAKQETHQSSRRTTGGTEIYSQ